MEAFGMSRVAKRVDLTKNSETPRLEPRGLIIETDDAGLNRDNRRNFANPVFRRTARLRQGGALLMTKDQPASRRPGGNPVNRARGEAVRRALLAVARQAHSRGIPMPPRPRLAVVLGCGKDQLWRHWARLVAEGAVVVSPTRTRHSRIHIKDVRP